MNRLPGPIACARDVPIGEASSGMPDASSALLDLFRPLRLGVVSDRPQSGNGADADEGEVKEQIRWVNSSGVVQAGDGEKLEILPEGDRSWESALLHCAADFNVATNSVIIVKGTRYRVTKRADWSASGFYRYELMQDYDAN